ncbi:MAG TPA: DUF370 domain-containing protein [Symbiobacteriaceae bacterium]
MFLHVGSDVTVSLRQVVAILNYRTSQVGEATREFLEAYRKANKVTDLSGGDPRSVVVTDSGIYLSPISSLTLQKRADFLRRHVLLDLEEKSS